jgi:hypothetical protein
MADRELPYDPYIPSGGQGGAPAQQNGGNQRTAALQAVSDTPYPSDHWYQAQGLRAEKERLEERLGERTWRHRDDISQSCNNIDL